MATKIAAGPPTEDAQCTFEQLTDHEASSMMIGPAITTVTFLRHEPGTDPSTTVRERFRLVVKANPWLTGSLVKKGGKLQLKYSTDWSKETFEALFNPRKGRLPKLHTGLSYEEICIELGSSAAEIPKGSACVNKPKPLVALSVIPDTERSADTIALVFSLSHVIADGYTYYQLLSMLSPSKDIIALNPTRKHDIGPQSKAAMGKEESAFGFSTAVIFNVISKMIFGGKPKISNHFIDNDRVKAAKDNAETNEKATYVSTNDVLCSAFANVTDARVLLMPLNFRERLPDFTATDAGNYEGSLVFGPEDYEKPCLLRETLQSGPPQYKRSVNAPLPSCMSRFSCKISMVTNWAFPFFTEVEVEGCSQLIHFPHCDVKMVPFNIGVIYRAQPGRLAITCFTRGLEVAELEKELPLGHAIDKVSDTL